MPATLSRNFNSVSLMGVKKIAIGSAVALVVLAGFLAWNWQPEKQAGIQTAHFLQAVERRNWEKVRAYLATNYTDRWGHDQALALEAAEQVFQQFLFLKVEHEIVSQAANRATGETRARVKISGSGGALAQIAMERVNGLREPFLFSWKRQSWKPWDWQITRIEQPELEIREW